LSYLKKLNAAQNRKELAKLLNYKPKSLTAIVYKTPTSLKYKTFDIKKKSGGIRVIKAPNPKLKKLQQHLANYLYLCQSEIEETRVNSPVSFGFRKGSSIIEHAKKHKRKRYVFNLDISNFFPSLNFGRVRGYFLKDNNFLLREEVATTIAQIACDGTALPQGSPCSPIISELICQILDLRLLRLAKKYGVTYSRYADDLTFSTNQKFFPSSLAFQDKIEPSKWSIGKELLDKINNSGFKVNNSKTRMQVRGNRQEVTGLVVNEKVNIKSRYYRNARAMCDKLFQTGTYYKDYIAPKDATEEPLEKIITSLHPLEGILSHIYTTTQSEEKRTVPEQRTNPRAIRELYRRFLFFKNCVALEQPLIITEGKTDPIYLREAIRHRSQKYPILGGQSSTNFNFKVRFFNYETTSHEVLDLGGGSGDLRSIPLDYLRNFRVKKGKRKPILYKPMQHPVIILLDNDEGLGPVAGTIKTNFGVIVTQKTSSDFYHVTENLYLIKTPEGTKQSCIEDLFPTQWLQKKLNNKKFNKSNKMDPTTEYGKEIFAKRIVQPNAKNIDFSGFDPLLDRIISVLKDHSSKKPPHQPKTPPP